MKVKMASVMGFCYGVRRAISLLEKAAEEPGVGCMETLGEVVHNRQVVSRLAAKGISPVENIAQLNCPMVAITSHGVGPGVLAELQSRSYRVVDATCPWVRRAQRAAHKLAEAGFAVMVLGDADHPEVKGVLEWAGDAGRVTQGNVDRLYTEFPHRLGVLSQTTQSPRAFAEFVKKVTDRFLPGGVELRVVNTICDATQKRQEAALKLAHDVDIMIVVGGRGSANTRRLAEICSAQGVTTYQVETAAELEPKWFRGKRCVGVTAGASTPDEVIQEVIHNLEKMEESVLCNMTNSASTSTSKSSRHCA